MFALSVTFSQLNGDLGVPQIPSVAAAAAQAQAAAVAAVHQKFDALGQSQNSSPQAPPMTSPPLQGTLSPHLQIASQVSATQQAQTSQQSTVPLPKQQVKNQMSPSGQMMTTNQSQGKNPPRESGKNLVVTTQAQSPVSQAGAGSSSGYSSATDNGLCAPNAQSQMVKVKTEPASPPAANSQMGKVVFFLFLPKKPSGKHETVKQSFNHDCYAIRVLYVLMFSHMKFKFSFLIWSLKSNL